MSNTQKHIYIASDFHLGIDAHLNSKDREKKIIRWLDHIKADARELLLIGDIFDFWFEYSNVVPKGHVRFIAKIAEFVACGIPVTFYTGNHDVWFFDYFKKEIGVSIQRHPKKYNWGDNAFLIGHGDGLGPGDHAYKFVKKIFTNDFCQWLYQRIHPDTGIWIMKTLSKQSRKAQKEIKYDLKKERLVEYCNSFSDEKIDFFIFGHRHLPIYQTLSNDKSVYINSGDWLKHYSYIKIINGKPKLLFFESENEVIYCDE